MAMAERIATITTTIMTSMRVKPRWRLDIWTPFLGCGNLGACTPRGKRLPTRGHSKPMGGRAGRTSGARVRGPSGTSCGLPRQAIIGGFAVVAQLVEQLIRNQ